MAVLHFIEDLLEAGINGMHKATDLLSKKQNTGGWWDASEVAVLSYRHPNIRITHTKQRDDGLLLFETEKRQRQKKGLIPHPVLAFDFVRRFYETAGKVRRGGVSTHTQHDLCQKSRISTPSVQHL